MHGIKGEKLGEGLNSNMCGNSLKASTSILFVFSSKNKELVSSDDAFDFGYQIVAHDLEKLTSQVQEHEMDVCLLKKVIQLLVEMHHNEDGSEALEGISPKAGPSSLSNNYT